MPARRKNSHAPIRGLDGYLTGESLIFLSGKERDILLDALLSYQDRLEDNGAKKSAIKPVAALIEKLSMI